MLRYVKKLMRKYKIIADLLSRIYCRFGFNRIRGHKGVHVRIEGAFIKKTHIYNYGKNNKITIKNGCQLSNCTFSLYGDNNRIEIADNVIGNQISFYVSDESIISIGKNTSFSGDGEVASLEGTTVSIGEQCLFSGGIRIRSGDSHSVIDKIDGKRINPAADIHIGNHVWMGQQAAVLKGTVIGDDSVVGMRSLITGKLFESGSLIAGVPAKTIRTGISWDYKT